MSEAAWEETVRRADHNLRQLPRLRRLAARAVLGRAYGVSVDICPMYGECEKRVGVELRSEWETRRQYASARDRQTMEIYTATFPGGFTVLLSEWQAEIRAILRIT